VGNAGLTYHYHKQIKRTDTDRLRTDRSPAMSPLTFTAENLTECSGGLKKKVTSIRL